ncbi:fibrinogen-like protein 1 [Drosophila grimshawi]|uniref:fibrinogen-like protein 1 n=1 Tax=Drosophila grimshawi TaxID=7222 RepID=UPI0013EF56E3|nr:fibrinogen-like protein 1 [Drosophila grimshawi]
MELNWVAFTLCISLILIKSESSFATTATKNEICKASRREEEQCGSYAYKAIKPLLIYMELMRTEVENYDNITSIKNREIKGLQMKISQYKSDSIKNLREQIIAGLREQIISKDNELKQLQQNVYETIIQELRNRTARQDSEIKELQKKLVNQYENVAFIQELRNQIDLYKNNNDNLQSIRNELNKLNSLKYEECTSDLISKQKLQIESDAIKLLELQIQLEEDKKTIEEKDQEISKLQNDVNKKSGLNDNPFVGCTSFGDVTDVHKTSFSKYSFDVLCDTETAGPRWTVIQQRINGKEDFNRSWTTYREGFGSFDGDFFLGLEKIHRLTSYKRFELYVYLEFFDGETRYARYQQFSVAGESDEYKLSISGFSGNVTDIMSESDNNQKFTTYDRDNDDWNDGNCAFEDLGGWWYIGECETRSLNSKYHNSLYDWKADGLSSFNPAKNVKMLIRPT